MGQPPKPKIRIGDVERNGAMDALGEHLASGRIDLAEYDERCAVIMAARTRDQLEELFADLPAPHPDLSSAVRPAPPPRKPVRTSGTQATAGKRPTGGTKSTKPADAKKGEQFVETRLSRALDNIAVTALFIGLPGAIVLTTMYGAWWTFFAVGGLFAVLMTVSDLVKREAEE
ncbi:DUF1707 SHOCT-like domain-containing protein [Actinophytocola sediminis]